MKTLVAIVAWNGGRHLEACLGSLLAQDPGPDVLVVDNASDDGSAELARSFGERFGGRLEVLTQPANLGFTAGANVALRHVLSRGEHDFVVLLNQDATLEADYLARIGDLFERRPEAGVVGARILYPDGVTVQHAGGWLERPRLLGRHRGQHQPDGPEFDVEQDVEYATGAVLALRVACLRAVGLFDEVFSPGYYEDVDLCVRARAAGWSVVYAPAARAQHAESASFSDELERWTLSHCSRLMFALPHLLSPEAAAAFAAAERASFAADPEVVVRAQGRAYLEALLRLPRAMTSRLPPEARPGAAAALAAMLAGLRTDCLAALRQRAQAVAVPVPSVAPAATASAAPLQACTIVARNYLAHARVLARSFATHHPDGSFTVLLVDDEERAFDATAEPFRCLRLHEIGLASSEVGRLAAIYGVTELATAVKPILLRHLLAAGGDHVVYLDPDIEVFAPLDHAAHLARQHSIVLTPHLTVPLPEDGRRVDDQHVLSSGAYNLGFVAVGARAHDFLNWWWSKTRRQALVDHQRMMFTDQRWIDLVPGLFEHTLLKEPGWNAAYWNLHAREITFADGRWLAGGQPLVFFHYSGYDPRRPHLLSYHQAERPRILMSERPELARLCREYGEKLRTAGLEEASATPYGWARLGCGVSFDRRMRRVYREALLACEQGTGLMPPTPFEGDGVAFLEWLCEPVSPPLRPRVPRYLDALWHDREDLQAAFPDLAGVDAHRFLVWVTGDGVAQERIAEPLLPSAEVLAAVAGTAFAAPSELRQGLNIAGYLDAELGLGEAARLVTTAVEAAGIPYSTLAYHDTSSRRRHPFSQRGGGRAPYDVNLVCVGPDRTPDFARQAGPSFFAGRRTAALWFWELEELPAPLQRGFEVMDEVWAASEFVARAVRAAGRRPVHTIPLPVRLPRCTPGLTRAALGLPEGFLFLFAFDFFSVLERKNPLGLVEAFCRAFAPGAGPRLVLKSINGDVRLDQLERLRAAVAGRPDVILTDGYLAAEDKNALVGLCDAYVSLHRSEGFGLTMAEAMALGKPVVATGYSGNLDFMTAENSYLVDWRPGSVPPECGPYPAGFRWAEPDLDHAAACLRRVVEQPTEAALKAQRGREDILTMRTPERAAAAIRDRLGQTRARR